MKSTLTFLSLALLFAQSAAADCSFVEWKKFRDTPLYKHPTAAAYLFRTAAVKVDADGAPNAYHPDDMQLHCTRGEGFKGLDCPANAGYPKTNWWQSALLPDPKDAKRAYIQPPPAPYAGYFVSQSSLTDPTKDRTDPAKYVDARNVPYLVFPGKFNAMEGTGVMGDVGYAVNTRTGKASAFIVAEVGPPNADLGEMSIALATALGGTDPNPRTGAGVPQGEMVYVVFPRSRLSPSWPLGNAQIDARAKELLDAVGGVAAVEGCKGAQ